MQNAALVTSTSASDYTNGFCIKVRIVHGVVLLEVRRPVVQRDRTPTWGLPSRPLPLLHVVSKRRQRLLRWLHWLRWLRLRSCSRPAFIELPLVASLLPLRVRHRGGARASPRGRLRWPDAGRSRVGVDVDVPVCGYNVVGHKAAPQIQLNPDRLSTGTRRRALIHKYSLASKNDSGHPQRMGTVHKVSGPSTNGRGRPQRLGGPSTK